MDTNDLVDRVAVDLAGTTGREIIRQLATGITAAAANLDTTSDAPSSTNDGTLIEIDQELMYVTGYSPSGGVYTHSVIRGYGGSTAAAHDAGALVRYNPSVPKARVLAAMHDLTLAAQYADQMLLVERGHLVDSGRPSDVLQSVQLNRTYGARVEVLARDSGPAVIPVRPNRA